jgi:hypothetical protein
MQKAIDDYKEAENMAREKSRKKSSARLLTQFSKLESLGRTGSFRVRDPRKVQTLAHEVVSEGLGVLFESQQDDMLPSNRSCSILSSKESTRPVPGAAARKNQTQDVAQLD